MPIRIESKHLELLKFIFEKWLPHCEVWAFGSRVNGNSKEHSDLDLVIIFEYPLDIQKLARLKDELSESNLPFKVDLVEWSRISSPFRDLIKNGYEVLIIK